MPRITLPDGSERQFDDAITGAAIAAGIGEGLARAAVAVRVNGELWDLTREIEEDASVEIIVRESDDGIELLRHDAAHVLAEAVKELWPDTQVTIGPAIENGFYYDFSREEPFTEADLETIEQRMQEIVDCDESIEREVWPRLLPEFQPASPSRSTGKANSSISVAAPTCPRRASSARPSN